MLALGLAGSPVSAAAGEQVPAPEPRRPIARAITPEAIRLAIGAAAPEPGQPKEQASRGWSKVRRLKPGTEIIVTVAGTPLTRHALLIDDAGLTVLNLRDPVLTPEARRELLDAAADHPERLSHDRPSFVGTYVRVGPDGVFVGDLRLADPRQLVERIARDEVARIVRPVRRRGSKWGAVGGAAVGGFLGFASALTLAMRQCGESCKDEERWMVASIVGFPLAGGLLGYHGLARRTAEVIYDAR
jgi:hypothetical protein